MDNAILNLIREFGKRLYRMTTLFASALENGNYNSRVNHLSLITYHLLDIFQKGCEEQAGRPVPQ